MTRADLEALAQRVEREEPSRELDDAIATAINAPRGWIGATALCRDYTSSLDAAASLVDGYWTLDNGDPCLAILGSACGKAKTPAAALTAAALRARAMELSE